MVYKTPQLGDIFKCTAYMQRIKHLLVLDWVKEWDYTCLVLETGDIIELYFHPYSFPDLEQVG